MYATSNLQHLILCLLVGVCSRVMCYSYASSIIVQDDREDLELKILLVRN